MTVSYIGNRARMFSNFLPLVQPALPCSACCATPMLTMPSSNLFSSTMTMFWFGPWVCWVVTASCAFSFRSLAMASP